MADSYTSIAAIAADYVMQSRVAACAAQQDAPGDPTSWAWENRLDWASAPGWGAAWDSAIVSGNPDPATDPGVISDGMILAQVQAMLGM